MTDATRYPLSWPAGWKRTPSSMRTRARFKKGTTTYGSTGSWRSSSALTVPQGLDRLRTELERLRVRDIIISTNVELNSYGDPRGGRRDPADPGVAVYFKMAGKDRVLACDCWDRTADNLASVAAHIECLRGIDRYGVGTLDQAFAGYDALPPPGATAKIPWRKVFEFAADARITRPEIDTRYRHLAQQFHPDLQGGSHEAMAMLNVARDEALEEVGNG